MVWRVGFLLSVGFHLLLFLFLFRGGAIPTSPFSAAGPRAMDDRAAEGAMVALQMGGAPDRDRPPPTPVPSDDVPPEPPEEEVPDATPEVEDADPPIPETGVGERGSERDQDRASGSAGLPAGPGAGDAGTADGGLNRITPPTPQGLFVPDLGSGVRGVNVRVWVFVNAEGRVVADSTRLEPPTRDRRVNTRLRDEAARWRFRPARQGAVAVASWFFYDVSVP
jgi:hypothetical protein